MTDLYPVQKAQGAVFAPDNIPLHFGDLGAEYDAARQGAVLLDRSHEARWLAQGRDRLALIHRISTNDVESLPVGAGRGTIFTNPTARILDRVEVYHLPENALILGDPGRGAALGTYLQGNIFFGDDMRLHNLSPTTVALDVHGPLGDDVIGVLFPEAASLNGLAAITTVFRDTPVTLARRKPVTGTRWTLLAAQADAGSLWQALTEAGAIPAGSLVYHVLRIRAGLPTVGRELTTDYIPLEVGLWDEVSFSKGCYTGQEIIARMESRGRLAKTLVRLELAALVDAPAEIYHEGKSAGRLTSSVTAPDGEIFALGVMKMALARPEQTLTVGPQQIAARITALAGVQPDYIQPEA